MLSVHTGVVVIGTPASGQRVLAGQVGAVVPPLQAGLVWLWQTIPDPQSLSLAQDGGMAPVQKPHTF